MNTSRPRSLQDSGQPRISDVIERLVQSAPRLTEEQTRRIGGLLATGGGGGRRG